jgi:CDP-diacylglycerol---glycerol-3-phosphate 3-phosphatidyltransferase
MASSSLKPAVNRAIEPLARTLSRIGVTPDAVTLAGTIATISAALYFYSYGQLLLGTILISLFTLTDLLDGAIARASERGPSKWGGFLDSTCDRLADASILMGLGIYLVNENVDRLTPVVLASIVASNLIPYIRAKAESYGISCTVGIAERTERLILTLVSIGFAGLGLPYVLAVGMWLLLILSLITVVQRVWVVRKGLIAHG